MMDMRSVEDTRQRAVALIEEAGALLGMIPRLLDDNDSLRAAAQASANESEGLRGELDALRGELQRLRAGGAGARCRWAGGGRAGAARLRFAETVFARAVEGVGRFEDFWPGLAIDFTWR